MRKLLLISMCVAISVAATIIVVAVAGVTTTTGSLQYTASYNDIDLAVLPIVDSTLVNSTVIPPSIVKGNNDFTINFYKMIPDDDKDKPNIFFSPTSMYTVFSVLYEGARGNTAGQIQHVFGFEPDAVTRHNDTAHMISAINQDDSYATLDLANALWIADWFDMFDSYLDVTQSTYLASAKHLDFTDKMGSVDKINQWASDNTNGKIKNVITADDVNDKTAMVINNAIYFKGTWLTQFSASDTRQSNFWNGKQNISTSFMNILASFEYTQSNDAQVLKMPYKGDRLSMLIILPDKKDGITQLENSISSAQIKQWNDALSSQRMDLSVPKFEMKTHYGLNDILNALGMVDVFSKNDANLSGIGYTERGNLYVSKATQDAYVKVNEEGTEAAAVTTVGSELQSGPVLPQFTADHPFLFLIQDDRSGMILFMGRVMDPAA